MVDALTSAYQLPLASPVLGAEISSVDLSRAVDDPTAEALREAFWAHKVPVFRDRTTRPIGITPSTTTTVHACTGR
jgi:alpha-ketoglutarate-dependent taurine dioxygenase